MLLIFTVNRLCVLVVFAVTVMLKYKTLTPKLTVNMFLLLREKILQFDWVGAVVFQLNLKKLHVKITSLLRVAV